MTFEQVKAAILARGAEVIKAELAFWSIPIDRDDKFRLRDHDNTPSGHIHENGFTDFGDDRLKGDCFHFLAITRHKDVKSDFVDLFDIARGYLSLPSPSPNGHAPDPPPKKEKPPIQWGPPMSDADILARYGVPWSAYEALGCKKAPRAFSINKKYVELDSIVHPITLPDGRVVEKSRSLCFNVETKKRFNTGTKGEFSKGAFGDPRQAKGAPMVVVGGEDKRVAAEFCGRFAVSVPCGESGIGPDMAAWLLAGEPSEVIVALDAGERGARAAVSNLLAAGAKRVRLVKWGSAPAGTDLNDVLKNSSAQGVRNLLDAAEDCTPETVMNANVEFTDEGRGIRFAKAHKGTILWHVEHEAWMQYTGTHWTTEGAELEAQRRAVATAKSLFDEASKAEPDRAARIARFAADSLSQKYVKIAMEAAKRQPGMSYSASQFDADHMLFNCANGTIDLRTGRCRPHNPRDLITKISRIRYDASEKCPAFLQFMHQIMCGRADMVEFLQRSLGYSMTGSMAEQCMWIFYGAGSNGKSVLLRVIMDIFGDMQYAASINRATIVPDDDSRGLSAGSARPDLCALVGTRFGWVDEPKGNGKIDSGMVKAATAGDPMQIRQLHGRCFTHYPTTKMYLASNHKPKVKDTDDGFWRRIRLVPFDAKFHDPENGPAPSGVPLADKKLPATLASEYSGILNWLIEGCLLWQASGLKTPKDVIQATRDYREASDPLANFIATKCSTNSKDIETVATLYAAYELHCGETGEDPMPANEFGKKLGDRGFEAKTVKNQRCRCGIRLADKPPVSEAADFIEDRNGF